MFQMDAIHEEIFMGFQALMHNYVFVALIGVIVFDYLTGVAKAYIWKVGDSQVGLKGLTKHGLVMLAFFLVYPFAGVFNGEAFVHVAALLYIMNYLLSILENFGVMGIYVPKFLENKIKAEIARYENQLDEGLTAKQLAEKSNAPTVNIDATTLVDAVKVQSEVKGGD